MSHSVSQSSSDSSYYCLPNTSGKTAAVGLTMIGIAGAVIATLVLLHFDPSLNTTFYPVYGLFGGIGIVIFVISVINMCKNTTTKSKTKKVKIATPSAQQVVLYSPIPQPQFQMPHPYIPQYYPQPPQALILGSTQQMPLIQRGTSNPPSPVVSEIA